MSCKKAIIEMVRCDSDQCENDDDYFTASQRESDDENDDEFIKVIEYDPFWSE